MSRSKRELLMKLQSLINRYRGAENFVHMMDEWPKTVRELVFSSTPLMIRLGMLMPLDNYRLSMSDNNSFEDRMAECKKGNHYMKVIAHFPTGPTDVIIRWCYVCGSVVGDSLSYSPKKTTLPGTVFKMKLPEISK